MDTQPYYLLFTDASLPGPIGRWQFTIKSYSGDRAVEVSEDEECDSCARLELLAVIRGLESLDQPSRVTLATTSEYVRRGIRLGMDQWRESGWRWERFGRMVPVANEDLWKRLDAAMSVHSVTCRTWRIECVDNARSPELKGPHYLRSKKARSKVAQKRAS